MGEMRETQETPLHQEAVLSKEENRNAEPEKMVESVKQGEKSWSEIQEKIPERQPQSMVTDTFAAPISGVEQELLTGAPTADAFGKQMLKQENIYPKGNVLMVGQRIPKNKGAYETDGVILYHSYCLGNHPYLLQDDRVELTQENVYICGHSNKKKQTISGYTMLEIAGMLYHKCKYRGEQKIVIITGYSKYKNENKEDMADLLREGLETFGIKAEVEAFAQHTAVLVEYFGNAYANDIPYASYIFAKIQDRMLRKIGKHPLVLEMESYQREISEYIMSSGIEVARFNHSVIKRSRNKVTWVTFFLKGAAAVLLVVGLAAILGALFF